MTTELEETILNILPADLLPGVDLSDPGAREGMKAAIDTELPAVIAQVTNQVRRERLEALNQQYQEQYNDELKKLTANHGDKALFRAKWEAFIEKQVQISPKDPEIIRRVINNLPDLAKRAGHTLASNQDMQTQAQLQSAFEAERAKITIRGMNAAHPLAMLETKYRNMGLRFGAPLPDQQEEKPTLTDEQRAKLTEEYQAELRKWRGKPSMQETAAIRYRKLGLDV